MDKLNAHLGSLSEHFDIPKACALRSLKCLVPEQGNSDTTIDLSRLDLAEFCATLPRPATAFPTNSAEYVCVAQGKRSRCRLSRVDATSNLETSLASWTRRS